MAKYEWQETKTIHWSDELNDDFGDVGLTRPEIPPNYNYLCKHRFLSFLCYYLLAKPILSVICFFKGTKVKARKNIKDLRHKGYFIYANHVSWDDAFKYAAYAVPAKRVSIIGYSDALSLKGLGALAKNLGLLPIPNDMRNLKKMTDAIARLIKKKQIVLIFPEAHIWPYYTKIRSFKSVSFHYPASLMAPIIPAVTVWRGKKFRKPKQTIVFGEPIFPKEELSIQENKQYLRDQCLEAMRKISDSFKQNEYINYIKVEKEN